MSSSSSETMCTSTDDCRCQEHVRHILSPNCSYAQTSTSSAVMRSTSGSFEPTSDSTVKSCENSSINSSLRSRGMSSVPSEISTWEKRCSISHDLNSTSLPRAYTASNSVPPQTTGVASER